MAHGPIDWCWLYFNMYIGNYACACACAHVRTHPYFTPDYEWEKCTQTGGNREERHTGVVAEFCQYVDNNDLVLPSEVPTEVANLVNLDIEQSQAEKDLVKSAQVLVRDALKNIESATYLLEDRDVLARTLQQLRSISEEISESIGSDVKVRSDKSYKTLAQLSQQSRKMSTTRNAKVQGNLPSTSCHQQTLPVRRSHTRGRLWRRREGASIMDSIVELYKTQHDEALLEQMWEAGETDETLLAVGELLKKFEEENKTDSCKCEQVRMNKKFGNNLWHIRYIF